VEEISSSKVETWSRSCNYELVRSFKVKIEERKELETYKM
jgi:hypothetical protein